MSTSLTFKGILKVHGCMAIRSSLRYLKDNWNSTNPYSCVTITKVKSEHHFHIYFDIEDTTTWVDTTEFDECVNNLGQHAIEAVLFQCGDDEDHWAEWFGPYDLIKLAKSADLIEETVLKSRDLTDADTKRLILRLLTKDNPAVVVP